MLKVTDLNPSSTRNLLLAQLDLGDRSQGRSFSKSLSLSIDVKRTIAAASQNPSSRLCRAAPGSVCEEQTVASTPSSPAMLFDFQPSSNYPLQTDAIMVDRSSYTQTGRRGGNQSIQYNGFGWTKIPGGETDAGSLHSLQGNPYQALLRDYFSGFHLVDSAGIFRVDLLSPLPVQLTAFLGDANTNLEGNQVAYSTDGINYTPYTPGGGLEIPANHFTHAISPPITPINTGGVYPIWIRFQDAVYGGATYFTAKWSASGFAIQAVDDVQPLTISSFPPIPADALNQDTFTITGAFPGAVLTITAQRGTILTDMRPEILGNQTIADAAGAATFIIRRPFVDGNSTITAVDFLGRSKGSVVQKYDLVATRKFDMKANTGGTIPGPDWLPVYTDTDYSASQGYGWVNHTSFYFGSALTGFPSGATNEQKAFYSDYHFDKGVQIGKFTVYIGANRTVNVKIYSYDAMFMLSNYTTVSTGGAFQGVSSSTHFVTLPATSDSTGLIHIQFKTSMLVGWAVNAIEIQP